MTRVLPVDIGQDRLSNSRVRGEVVEQPEAVVVEMREHTLGHDDSRSEERCLPDASRRGEPLGEALQDSDVYGGLRKRECH